MTGFTKLFSSIVHSTIWRDEMHVKIVWITMLALANRNGDVLASMPGLADASRVSLDQCQEALKRLSGPDKWSRTQEHEGRRIEEVDGGWNILNYMKYREVRNADERRLQTRAAVQKFRAKKKAETATVSPGKPRKPKKAHTEADTEADTDTEEEASSSQGIDRYYIACTIALNHGMQENPTVEGEWMPVTASSQVARVTWCEDGIPLGIVEEIILERSKGYRCSGANRGPRSLKYFDQAVRETWERGQQSASDAKVSKVLGR